MTRHFTAFNFLTPVKHVQPMGVLSVICVCLRRRQKKIRRLCEFRQQTDDWGPAWNVSDKTFLSLTGAGGQISGAIVAV